MNSTALIKSSAIVVLIAFAISFFLPVYTAGWLDHVGWDVAYETLLETFHPHYIYDVLCDALFDLANLVTPLILVMLAIGRFRGRSSLFGLVILALCVGNAAPFVTDHMLLIGYWVWWGCQLATLAIGIWSRFRPPQMVPASVVPAKG
ncbi:MAG TPA: hypothetical protein VNV14_03160 [Opitutaceae bacterium]|jgi:hypothetical protein|nr:hypothetical protein [Opitutaceae bacterium]